MRDKHILAAALCCLLLNGCTKEYSRNDIQSYAEEICGQKPKTVSKEPEKQFSDSDTYTDYLWTITLKDGTAFHVLDDYHWGMEALVNTLRDDYASVSLLQQFDQLPVHRLKLVKAEEEGLVLASLETSYSSRDELNACLKELQTVKDAAKEPLRCPYSLYFDHPYRTIGSYESTEADVHGNLGNASINSSEAEKNLLLICLDHQYPARDEFSSMETEATLSGYNHRIGFRTSDQEPYDFSLPLVASSYSYGISFAALHEVLEAMHIAVNGDVSHYSFTDGKGHQIEIGYDMRHPYPDGQEGYYYLCDGEETDMDSYFYNHFTSYELRNDFGLDIIEYWQTAQN